MLDTLFDLITHHLGPFVLVIGILVFVHELGHYGAARLFGVHVEAFSIGIGPEIVGWTDKRGTRWRLSLLPLGGYARFLGDADASSRPDPASLKAMSRAEQKRTLTGQPPGARIVVALAGPAANYLLALLLFWGITAVAGQRWTLPVADTIIAGSPAERAGLKPGDRILTLNGHPVDRFEDLGVILAGRASPADPVDLGIERPGTGETVLAIVPEIRERKDVFGHTHRVPVLGVGSTTVSWKPVSAWQALGVACAEVWHFSTGTLKAFWQMITGARSSDDIGGPIRMAQMSGHMFSTGNTLAILGFVAMLSVTLGLINLLPVPVLDGGHVVMALIEKITGRPLADKAQERAFQVGLVFVGSLMLLAFWNDLNRLAWFVRLKEGLVSVVRGGL
jgi:regulator of sigma E protease